jgi:hypothetical protein
MEATFRGHPLQSLERPDTFYAFVAGLYAAALLSPAAVVALALWVSGDPGVLYVGLLTAVTTIVAVTAWGVTRWRGLPERIGASRLAWSLAVLPVVAVAGYFAVVAAVDTPAVDAGAVVGFLLGSLGIVVGIGLVVMSRNRYAEAVVDGERVEAVWTAGWPEHQRMRFQYASLVAMSLFVPVWAAGYLWDALWIGTTGNLLFLPVILLGNVGRERTYRVTPAGLERNNPVSRYVYRWNRFESYEVTDEVVVVRWRSWWRPAIRCARAEIDEENAVMDALGRYLPR